MTTLSLPILAGQGWSVHKKPTFATLVAPHVSGREVRSALYTNPIWKFEATYDGLDSSLSTYPGLGGGSLQSLMGLFLQCQGQLGTFLYYDPTDYSVTTQPFGVGDGTTTTFPLLRTLGGFSEPIVAPFNPSGVSMSPISSTVFASNNLLTNSVGAGVGLLASAVTIATGQPDPFGGVGAAEIIETTANSAHYAYHTAVTIQAGGYFTASAYLLAGGSTYQQLGFNNAGSGSPFRSLYANFNLSTGAVTKTGVGNGAIFSSASATPVGAGWLRCSISGYLDGSSTSGSFDIAGVNGSAVAGVEPIYVGSISNSVYCAYPQFEQVASAGAGPTGFNPTLTTQSFGGPAITVGAIYVDPSAYSIANGIVTFAVAPTAGAALHWSGAFGFLCRFEDDDLDFEEFMASLWRLESLKFQSLRAQ